LSLTQQPVTDSKKRLLVTTDQRAIRLPVAALRLSQQFLFSERIHTYKEYPLSLNFVAEIT